jgi:hypothetical protein
VAIAAKVAADAVAKAARKEMKLRAAGYDDEPLTSLPAQPDRHPTSNWKNHANPSEVFARSTMFNVVQLLDRRGRPPAVAYLVEWDTDSHQFTWSWSYDLKNIPVMKSRINKWKIAVATGKTTLNAVDWQAQHFSGASAAGSGRCFLEAFQATLFFQGQAGQVSNDMWEEFSKHHPVDMTHGAKKADQVAFYRFARDSGVLYNFNTVTPNRIAVSVTTPHCFKKVADTLDPGWYVVHAAQHNTEHCFALRADVFRMHQVVDAFDETKTPPCHLEPLGNLQWINKVFAIRRVDPTLTPYKRRKKSKKSTQNKMVRFN